MPKGVKSGPRPRRSKEETQAAFAEIAVKAIAGASGARTLAYLNPIAMEQKQDPPAPGMDAGRHHTKEVHR